jgi:hypothetical protein
MKTRKRFWNAVYVYMCVLLAPGQLNRLYSYSVFKSLIIIVPVKVNMPARKREALNETAYMVSAGK